MAYLISQLYPWILVSLLSGIMVGAFLCTPHERVSAIALTTCALLLALGLAAAWTAVVPGRMGLSLDILLTMAIPYGFGWTIGDTLRRRSAKRNTVPETLAPVAAATEAGAAPKDDSYLAFTRDTDQPTREPRPVDEEPFQEAGDPNQLLEERLRLEEERLQLDEEREQLEEDRYRLEEEPDELDEKRDSNAGGSNLLLISPDTSARGDQSQPPWSFDDPPNKDRRRPDLKEG